MSSPFRVLYISNLDHLAYPDHLWQAFAPWAASIRSIRVIRDTTRPMGFAHAYVNFMNHTDAAEALSATQPLFVNSSYCRVVPYTEPGAEKPPRPDPAGALYVKNLDPSVSVALLYSVFRSYGAIIECRIAIDDVGMPRGFGFVTFEDSGDAPAAIEALDGIHLGQQRIFVSPNVPRGQNGTKLFVRVDDPKNLTEDVFKETFTKIGPVRYAVMPKYSSGAPRGFGFVIYKDQADAQTAIDTVREISGSPASVMLASNPNAFRRNKDVTNLYVRPLGDEVTDDDLAEEFGQHGKIVSTRVMRNDEGESRGFGFVSFETASQAETAAEALNGQVRWGQELFVARAQGKRERMRRPWIPVGDMMSPAGTPVISTPLGMSMSPMAMPSQLSAGQLASPYGGATGTYPTQFIPASAVMHQPPSAGLGTGSAGSSMGMQVPRPMATVKQGQHGPEFYLVPVDYPYMMSYTAPTKEQLGESLHPRVLQHAAVQNDADLANQITGILLEQQPGALLQWLENNDVLNERIQQACDAYKDWNHEQKEHDDNAAQN